MIRPALAAFAVAALAAAGVGRTRGGLAGATVGFLSAGAVAALAGVDSALAGWLAAVAPGLGSDVYPTAAAVLVTAGPLATVAFAGYRAGGGSPAGFARGYALLVGPALAALATAPLFPTGWWLPVAVAALGATGAAATPWLVARVARVREPTSAERAALDHGVPVRVIESDRRNAMAAGVLPGARVVFVTTGLLEALPADEAAAVVAHEVGHLRRHHVALRLAAAAALVLPWLGAVAADLPGAFPVGGALVVLAFPALFRLVRWTEFDADAYAARAVDGRALARGLERLGGRQPRRPWWRRLVALHPTLAARASRLRVPDGGR